MGKLAIKGHKCRGEEIVNVLTMLGGKDGEDFTCLDEKKVYYIDDNNHISYEYYDIALNFIIYDIDDFLKSYPYKVGDTVRYNVKNGNIGDIASMQWNDKNNSVEYLVFFSCGYKILCAEELDFYSEKHNNPFPDISNKILNFNTQSCDIMKNMGNSSLNPAYQIQCPDNYQFKDENGNVINATKIILEKKNIEYPKTYEECCEIIGNIVNCGEFHGHKHRELTTLSKLILCRDAYWKIYGIEMGFGKSWEPDWLNALEIKHCITVSENLIRQTYTRLKIRILVFPTEEMRDAFHENFEDLIEECINYI